MKKQVETLAKKYDFKTKEGYYNYILESLINGNRQQSKNLFNQMKKFDQRDFLINYLKHDGGFKTSCKNICIGELCK